MSQAPAVGKRKRYVTILEAAELLNVAERTIFRMIGAQRLATMKTANGSRWVDLDDIERELQEKPRSASPVKLTIEHVLALVEELQEAREMQDHRIETLEQQIAALLLHEPVPIRSAAPTLQGIAGKLARRNLPAGTIRLVTFAEEHHLSAYAIKQWHEAGDVELTVYTRPNPAQRNQHEWWISQEQHQAVIAYCQQHAIPYVACLRCQSQDETDQQAV